MITLIIVMITMIIMMIWFPAKNINVDLYFPRSRRFFWSSKKPLAWVKSLGGEEGKFLWTQPWCMSEVTGGTILFEQKDAKICYIYTSGFLRIQKFTPKVQDSWQIQRYQKWVIRDISMLERLKNSVKH